MTEEVDLSIQTPEQAKVSFDIDEYSRKIISELKIKKGSIDITFVSKKQIAILNKKYLNRDYVTDIISFNLGDSSKLMGDIYICMDQAIENAKTYKNSVDNEIKRLLIHGILHLLDYQDYTDKEKEIMTKEENRLLKRLGA